GSTVQSDFTFTVNNPAKSVQFVYTGTLPVDSIVWKFGDGAKVKQAGPNHIYTAQGTYTVCAIAYMPCGRHMMCKEVTLVCPTPAANYTYTVTAATKTVNVTYTGSTPVDSVQWTFGDGGTAKGNTASHTYAGGDTYTVCAIAYNSCGSDTICQSVVVPVGIENVTAFAGLSIYPNPVQSVLYIDGTDEG